ncbi:hypothetical protein ACFH04_10605 [Streptomyces noboritoensis]|uniref:Uncharacterized protein n=1 Tax=Streptomyces noboritoensis TaxID=67337 RepID=A0ABV6TEC6_9ACTN
MLRHAHIQTLTLTARQSGGRRRRGPGGRPHARGLPGQLLRRGLDAAVAHGERHSGDRISHRHSPDHPGYDSRRLAQPYTDPDPDGREAAHPAPAPTKSRTPKPPAPGGNPTTKPTSATHSGSCEIVSNAGNCYNAGQFCRKADLGRSTHAANGRMIYCRIVSGRPHWQY